MLDNRVVSEYVAQHGKIKVAIAGIGYIAKGLINQIALVDSIEVVGMASKTRSKMEALVAKHKMSQDLIYDSIHDLVTTDADIIIDLTGDVETGARLAYDAIHSGKHIICSAETDATVGPALGQLAREKGVIYTNMWGDEPGLIKGLYDYASVLGFEIIALGKFKGFHNPYADPDSVRPWAEKSGQNPVVISSFADGSKMSMEMTIVANATGFVPDVHGMHLPESTLEGIPDLLRLTTEGGILQKKGVIEVVRGAQPSGGVYALIRCEDPDIIASLNYYKMGDGPNYMLYMPYHMPGIEFMYGILEMMILKRSNVEPMGAPVADVMTFAKRDLAVGDVLGSIGDFDYFGEIELAEVAYSLRALPLGMAKHGVITKPLKRGELITLEHVTIQEHERCIDLRIRYNAMLKEVHKNG